MQFNFARWCAACFFLLSVECSYFGPAFAVEGNLDPEVVFYNALPYPVLLIDPKSGKIRFANDEAVRFYGYSEHDLTGMLIQQINQFTEEQVKQELRQAEAEHRNFFVFQHKLASGDVRTVEVRSHPISFRGERVLHSVIRDISDGRSDRIPFWRYQSSLEEMVDLKREMLALANAQQKQWMFGFLGSIVFAFGTLGLYAFRQRHSRLKLRAANAELALAEEVFQNAVEGILVTDPTGAIIKANPSVSKITGFALNNILGNNPRMFSSGLQPLSFYKAMWCQLKTTGAWSGEMWNKHADGTHYAQKLSISALKGAKGETQNYLAVFSDITALKNHQSELEYVAHFDPLTGLPNRVLFRERLQAAINSAKEAACTGAVIYFDLDGFKDINDRFGHDVGDEVLIIISKRLQAHFGADDTLARLGGDEFVGVFSRLEAKDACKTRADNLLADIKNPVLIDGKEILLSTSIGITWFGHEAETDPDRLLREGDTAMYQSKLEGKDRFSVFNPKTELELAAFNSKVNALSDAIDNKELVFHFQPKIDVLAGTIHSAEALVRWQPPDGELRFPGSFLDATEDFELAQKLDKWALAEAFRVVEHWHRAGLKFPISVNIDPRSLTTPWLHDTLRSLLRTHSTVDPRFVDIEVLENARMVGDAAVETAMMQCQRLGFSFSIDDFGTGYSTLTHLRHLPAEHVKIDQSFVRASTTSLNDLAIVDAVLGLAGALNKDVIAEGVETQDHQRLLVSLGTSLLQGYSIARPMPMEAFIDWVDRFGPDPDWRRLQSLSKRRAKILYLQVELRNWVLTLADPDQGKWQPCSDGLDQIRRSYWSWMTGAGKDLFYDSPHFIRLVNKFERLMNQVMWCRFSHGGCSSRCNFGSVEAIRDLAEDCIHTINDILLQRPDPGFSSRPVDLLAHKDTVNAEQTREG